MACCSARWSPRSPAGDLPDYYRSADFLVLPSTHSESFGLVVLEAFASGKPAVVSSLPGPAALVDEGKDGLVARAGDAAALREAMLRLHRDRPLREAMGTAGCEKVRERFTWGAVAEKLEEAFFRIVGR